MNKWLQLIKKEIIHNRLFMFGWSIALSIFNFMMYFLYPGENGLQGFLGLLDNEFFQALLGSIKSDAAPLLIWMSFALPMLGLITFIASMMFGARTILLDVELGTHESFFPLPIDRSSNLLVSIITGQFFLGIFNFSLLFPWFFPIQGTSVERTILINLFIINQMFFTMGYFLGMFFAILGGNLGMVQQFSLLFVLIFYSLQIVSRANENLRDLQGINFLGWYEPNTVLFLDQLPETNLQRILVGIVFLGTLNFWLYPRKEFEKDIVMLNIGKPFGKKLGQIIGHLDLRNYFSSFDKKSQPSEKVTVQVFSKSSTSGIFVFWARAFKQRLPYTADFLFSEARVMTIMFWIIVMFYPLQFFAYPGDEEVQGLVSGFSGGFINLTTYGYALSSTPYTWWIVTQAIGVHWFFMFPLSLYWGKKIVSYDRDRKTGDLIGSLPIEPSHIISQRMFAVLLELHLLYTQMAVYTIFSDQAFGHVSEIKYHIIAIYGLIPLYFCLTLLIALPIYFFKDRGVIISRLIGLVVLLWFIIPYMTQTSVGIFEAGIIGFYNPVKIIVDRDLNVASKQILIFLAGIIPSCFLLIRLADKIPFIDAY